MNNCVVIALDAMSGDFGLESTLNGIKYFIKNYNNSNIFFNIFGDESSIKNYLDIDSNIYKIYDTGNNIIGNNEKPAHVIRNSAGTSMHEAIASVANGISDCVVSSGNTGAYMALSKIIIGTIGGISRPALVNVLPCEREKTIMLDLGANTECSVEKLYQFAIMGNAVAKSLFNINKPKIGILNIGTEKEKGTEVLEETYDLLSKTSTLNFYGFVEGNDITKGTVDVIVTDGFSGNVALKTMEGSIKLVISILKKEIESNIVAKLCCS
ncbi:MAG: phosphate acyltransferase PlsX [Alphaproteobacteria bacterium]|nr:phosphate acyltransferase PlsX [Alphaproteobacteria bacterium]